MLVDERQDRSDLIIDDDDKEIILLVPVLQKRQDRLKLLADDEDKVMIGLDPVLQKDFITKIIDVTNESKSFKIGKNN